VPLGVIITDSIGRAWRLGTVGHAIGAAGVTAVLDLRGRGDLFDRQLQVSEVAVADSVAAAAVLAMGEAAEGTPVVLVRGVPLATGTGDGGAAAVLRNPDEDLFR
jgi:coenzyme F420-0:L-glutamate ligase/coenzyme F420-1:gamma-L-glutamate ligase